MHPVFSEYAPSIQSVCTQYSVSMHPVFGQYARSIQSVCTQYSISMHPVFGQHAHPVFFQITPSIQLVCFEGSQSYGHGYSCLLMIMCAKFMHAVLMLLPINMTTKSVKFCTMQKKIRFNYDTYIQVHT